MADTSNTSLPLLRPGILHFLGSFVRLDESRILEDPLSFALTSEKVEKGAMSFHSAISPDEKSEKKSEGGGGWQILCTGLGVPLDDIRQKSNQAPQSYVTQVWTRVMASQGLLMSLNIEKDANGKRKGWRYQVTDTQVEDMKTAMRRAITRYENSPIASSPTPAVSKPTTVTEDASLDRLGKVIVDAIDASQRVLFLVADARSAREMIPFLFQHGVHHSIMGTSALISSDKRLTTSPKEVHNAQFLLMSVNFFAMRYEPRDYDLVVLYNMPEILNNLHVSQPLPNFIQMSRSDGRKNTPSYYKDLWRAADIFHLVRHLTQEAGLVWATHVRPQSCHKRFLERLRGSLTDSS